MKKSVTVDNEWYTAVLAVLTEATALVDAAYGGHVNPGDLAPAIDDLADSLNVLEDIEGETEHG